VDREAQEERFERRDRDARLLVHASDDVDEYCGPVVKARVRLIDGGS